MQQIITVSPGAALPDSAVPRVAVIGGGFAGACVAIHLLQRIERPLEIAVVEPRAALGHGLAYGTDDPAHRINVPSDKMSVFAEDPLHFTRWLERTGERAADPEGETPSGWHFSRRQVFGAYMADVLRDAVAQAPAGTRVFHVRDRAIAVSHAGPKAHIGLEQGGSLDAQRAVFVASHERPVYPFALDDATARHPGLVHDPWQRAALEAIAADKRVVILGTGLTMVDVAAGLLGRGHRGRIVAVSRRGQLPQPHGPFEPVVDVVRDFGRPATVREALRMARALSRREIQAGRDWHLAIDGIRRAAEGIWRNWPEAEQRRALARLRPFWDTHRYRIAPQLHRVLSDARATGQLQIRSARVKAITANGETIHAALQERGQREGNCRGNVVINCMGPSPDIRRSPNPVIRDLLDQGFARPDAHRLGLDVDERFRLRDGRGIAAQELRAVGPLTRGVFWEVVGVPELSDHCRRLAAQLSDELDTQAARPAPLSA